MIREKIRGELPTLLKLYRADKFLVNKIVASATAFFDEVRGDPRHPFRGEFDRMVLSFVDRLGSDRSYADRIDGLKRDLLGAPRTRRPRAQYLVERALVYRTQRQRRDPGAAATSCRNVHEGRRGAGRRCRTAGRDQSGPGCRAQKFYRRSEERRLELHLRSGQGLGHGAADFADRNQHRQGSAIHPLQRIV